MSFVVVVVVVVVPSDVMVLAMVFHSAAERIQQMGTTKKPGVPTREDSLAESISSASSSWWSEIFLFWGGIFG
jgi:hypothetical protein